MKNKIKILLLVMMSAGAVFGARETENRRFVDSSWSEVNEKYAPPFLSNGDVSTMMDFRNCQFQDVPSYKKIRCVGSDYRPAIYRAGRRTDNTALACFGRIEERVNTETNENTTPDKWRQELDVFRANSIVENYYGKAKISSTAFIAKDKPIIAIQKRFSGDSLKSYTFEYLFAKRGTRDEKLLHTTINIKDTDANFVIERAARKNMLKGVISIICDSPNAKIENDKNSIRVAIDNPKGDIAFFVVFVDDFEKNNYKKQLVEIKKEIATGGWNSLKNTHEKAMQNYWGNSYINIPDKEIETAYYTGIYNLKCCSTKWAFSGGISPTHWEGKIFGWTFFNHALCATGHLDAAVTVGKFRFDTLGLAKFRAGTRPQHNCYVGARYNWLQIETGEESTTLAGRWLDHYMHMPKIAQDSFICFRYSNDKEYLEKISYPVLKECAEFFRHQTIYRLYDGRTVIGKNCDLERLPSALENPFLTTVGAMYTFNVAAESAELFGIDSEYVKEWRKLSQELGKYLPHNGERYLPYPNTEERSVGVMSGIFPFELFDTDNKLQRSAVYDFEKNGLAVGNPYTTGKGMSPGYALWLGGAQARYGDGESAYRSMKWSTASVGKFYETAEINEPGILSLPWSSSTSAGYVWVINEMLLQCTGDTIKIAPAVPSSWKDFSFKLYAYDDLRITASIKDGKLESLKFEAGKNSSMRPKTIILPNGKSEIVKFEAGKTTIIK